MFTAMALDQGQRGFIIMLWCVILVTGCDQIKSLHEKPKAITDEVLPMKKDSADLAAISALHRADEQLSLEMDFGGLRLLLSDEAVILPPGGDPISGKETLDAMFSKMTAAPREEKVLEYKEEFEVVLEGDIAFEWGTISGRSKLLKTGETIYSANNVMRMLRKESGRWKIYRSIWNERKKINKNKK